VSELHSNDIDEQLQERIFQAFADNAKRGDYLIFSDFNYGCLPQSLVERLRDHCVGHEIHMAADSQSSSQEGDICRFKDVGLVCATEREARLGLRDFQSGLVTITKQLAEVTKAQHVFLKLGAEGVVGFDANADQLIRIPALNKQPLDTAGAGDSMLITAALSQACGANIWESLIIGSIAASIQVNRLGNSPLKQDDFAIAGMWAQEI